MSIGLLLQYALIAAALVASLRVTIKKMMPRSKSNCGDGCGSCGGCDASTPKQVPIKFHSRNNQG
jgi:hypothetical protein